MAKSWPLKSKDASGGVAAASGDEDLPWWQAHARQATAIVVQNRDDMAGL
jgi:hypothetical protein